MKLKAGTALIKDQSYVHGCAAKKKKLGKSSGHN
jgi:hypothetical protein